MRKPGLRDIAEKAGVSIATVSMALRHDPRIREETGGKVREIAQAMGYFPNAAMREAMIQTRSGEKTEVGETLIWLTNHPGRHLFTHAKNFAREQGFHLECFEYHAAGSVRELRQLRRLVQARGVRGILIDQLGASPVKLDPEIFKEVRIVSLDEGMEPRGGICRVLPDIGEVVRQAMKLVFERGYRRPGLMHNHWLDKEMRLRHHFMGLRSAMNMQGEVPFLHVTHHTPEQDIREWLQENRVDVVLGQLSMHALKLTWLDATAGDPGLVLLDKPLPKETLPWNPEMVVLPGEKWMQVAVSQLIAMIQHGAGWELFSVGSLLLPPQHLPGNTLPEKRTQNKKKEGFRIEVNQLRPLDFGDLVNQGFQGMGGWFGELPLLSFKPGRRLCAGIPFEVPEGKRNFILMPSSKIKQGQFGRLKARVRIPLKCAEDEVLKSVLILHSCGYVKTTEVFARYRWVSEAGDVSEEKVTPLTGQGGNQLPAGGIPGTARIQDWWVSAPGFQTQDVKPVPIAHLEPLDEFSGNFYVWRWRNPFPESSPAFLEIESDPESESTLGVLGITMVLEHLKEIEPKKPA